MSLQMDRYEEHVKKWAQRGESFGKYECPYCQYSISALIPKPGTVFSSSVICPACEGLHFKIAKSDGAIIATPMTKKVEAHERRRQSAAIGSRA